MTLGFGANSLMAKSSEPIRADGNLNERCRWRVLRTRAHSKAWLTTPKDFMSHGGAQCSSRLVQARRFPPSLYSAGATAQVPGARDIQETSKWQRPSSYQQSQSFYPRSWRATPRACPTSNVPGLARLSAARWVKSSKTANASRGPQSAASAVHCQTTSASDAECTAPLTRGNHDSQASRLLGRGSRAVFWRLNDIRGSASAKGQDKGTA